LGDFFAKHFYPIEFGQIILEKMEIGVTIFYKEKHGKLAHGQNLAPKSDPTKRYHIQKL